VAWHIRSLPFVGFLQKPGRFVVQRALALLSHLTKPVLVSNSSAAMMAHVRIGFAGNLKRWTIIPNGIDAAKYHPEPEDRPAVRGQLGIPDDALLIGCVGRFVPEKGYPVMFRALALVLQKLRPDLASRLHFLAVGNDVTAENPAFRSMATSCLPLSRLHLLGKRADVPRLLRALDIFVLPSLSESFPNSLVEAMATGLACTATDVGECREVLAAPEWVAPAGDKVQLADRIIALAEMTVQEREKLGAVNRYRIATHFTLNKMVASLDALFARAVFSDG
jgi:glycosyltransferase involved in cell wall biosynthesis